jgi:hypothetical protein
MVFVETDGFDRAFAENAVEHLNIVPVKTLDAPDIANALNHEFHAGSAVVRVLRSVDLGWIEDEHGIYFAFGKVGHQSLQCQIIFIPQITTKNENTYRVPHYIL